MLTQEQIKNLNPGDPVVVHGEFKAVDADGAVWIEVGNCHRWYALSCVSLPSEQPKHDPCRLFKKGDRIRFKTWHGFQPEDWENDAELLGKEATVYEDQKPDAFSVHFLFDGEDPDEEWHATYLPFIELVTPVEELEPYLMLENVQSNSIEVRDKRTNKVEATFYFGKDHAYTFVQAATRAEAERDRLNEEWRKEQNHE